MKNKLLTVLFIAILILASCESRECAEIDNYTLEIPFTLSPALDTFRIGDTITFSSKFEKNVMEFNTDKIYTLENFKFFPGTELNKIDVNPAVDGTNSFELIIKDSTNYKVESFSTRQYLRGEFNFDGQLYELTFQLIPKKSGLFHLEHGSRVGTNTGQNQSFEGKCSGKEIESISTLNDGAENNIELLLDSPDSYFNTWLLEKPSKRFQQRGAYCFYVVE